MASIELDPLFRRGLHLLHSRSRDASDQLKLLYKESLSQRQGKSLSAPKDPFNVRRESPIPRSKPGSPIPLALIKRDELKREHPSKLRDDDAIHSKRPRVDSPSTFKCHTPSPTPSIKSESSSRSRKSEDSDSEGDLGLSMDALTDGINCCICKNFEVYNGNTLVECQECHLLYHQECHRPAINHHDITADPRVVWYCAKCSRQMKKQTGIVSSASTSSSITGSRSMSSNVSGGSSMSSSSSSSKGLSSLPSRSNPSPSKVTGMQRPSPFANLSSVSGRSMGSSSNSNSNSSSSSSSTSGSSSSKSLSSNKQSAASSAANSMLSAERRMQMMKKKAAAKLADRRHMKI